MSGKRVRLAVGLGDITISKIAPAGTSGNTRTLQFLDSVKGGTPKAYEVTMSVREVLSDGTFSPPGWTTVATSQTVSDDSGLAIKQTGSSHLLIGAAFADDGSSRALGRGYREAGNIRNVYLFNTAVNRDGIRRDNGTSVDIANATSDELVKAGLLGMWVAEYDPNGVITNPFDQDAFAITTNQSKATLVPLQGQEREGVSLYVNGAPMSVSLVTGAQVPASMTGYTGGQRQLAVNAGAYRLAEVSMWSMARQQFQIVDDMFGRLIPTNEPFLQLYLSGSFLVSEINAPILPMNKFIDNIKVSNSVASLDLAFSNGLA